MQDLAKCLDGAFGSDQFFAALSRKEAWPNLLTFAMEVVDSWNAESSQQRMQGCPECLAEMSQRMNTICAALVCLLHPQPKPGTGPKDVSDIIGYKGESPTMNFMKNQVNKSEALQARWNEVLAKYLPTKELMPQIDEYCHWLGQTPVSDEVLTVVIEKLPIMKEKVRAGALRDMELSLHKALHARVEEVLETDAKDVTMSVFSALLSGLKLYSDPPSFALQAKLKKLEGSASQRMLLADLLKSIAAYPNEDTPEAGDRDFSSELEPLLRLLEQAKGLKLDSETQEKMGTVVFWHLRSLFFTVRDAVLEVSVKVF